MRFAAAGRALDLAVHEQALPDADSGRGSR